MKHKFRDIEGSRREFTFEIPAEEVKERLERAYGEIGREVTIPGFRKGKAPRELIEKYHGDQAREKAARDLVNDSYWQALEETNTSAVGLPLISDVELAQGKAATYKATVDIRPAIELADYGRIKVTKKKAEVTDEDVDRYISTIRESYAKFKTVEDRPAGPGDYVVCDVSCFADGKPVHEERKDVWFLMDKEHSLPELVDGLAGSAGGQVKEIEAALPEDKSDPSRSNKRALFKVKVKMVKEKELPALDEEFIKSVGPYKTVEELRAAARTGMEYKKENEAKDNMWNQVLDNFLKNARFEPPAGLVEEEMARLADEAKDKMKRHNLKEQDIARRMEEIKKTLREEAGRRVRLYFIIDEIAGREGITAADEEVEKAIEAMARQYNTTPESMRKHYSDKNLLGYLKNRIKENKVREFLFTKIDIKEEGGCI
jgi:trigger factor